MSHSLLCLCGGSVLLVLANAATAGAQGGTCKRLEGFLEETLVSGPACTSAVGLCTVAKMFGHLKGEAKFTATAFIPTSDTPATGVVFVTGDTTIVDAKFEDRRGTLTVKNAAAFNTISGDLVDNQTIIAGTDGFAGATGSLRISGTFLADEGGTSKIDGTLCLP